MATREENLKKINDELEKLSDEELDKVAGGGDTPEEIVELLKKYGDLIKNTDKPIEDIMKLFGGGKTSKS